MRITVGNAVEGEDFYGREVEMRQLWDRLATDHILMLAPRRIGKTSLLRRLRDTGDAHHVAVVVCSFADCSDEFDCIKRIIDSLNDHNEIKNYISKTFTKIFSHVKGIKLGPIGIDLKDVEREQWHEVGENLTHALSQFNKNILICVDELPIFILKLLNKNNDGERARSFLNWFRNLRQQHTKNVKWVLAGSIGLDTVAARFRMGDTINDLTPYPIEAFTGEVAQGLLQKLVSSNSCTITPEICSYIIERVGWPVPYYLQALFRMIKDHLPDTRKEIEKKDVDTAFEALLRPAHKVYFDYWRQRLTDELGTPQDNFAIMLLNALCQDPHGSTKETLNQVLSRRMADSDERQKSLNYLLEVLENDGYIIAVDGRYRFRMVLLQEYWKRRVLP